MREVMRRLRVAPERYVLRKAVLRHVSRANCRSRSRFLHVDADWYDSVLLVLETFYDRVVEGGVIVMDDFGHWKAVGRRSTTTSA